MKLKYVGKGRWFSGVPARDLTEEDLARIKKDEALAEAGLASAKALAETTLYEKVKKEKTYERKEKTTQDTTGS